MTDGPKYPLSWRLVAKCRDGVRFVLAGECLLLCDRLHVAGAEASDRVRDCGNAIDPHDISLRLAALYAFRALHRNAELDETLIRPAAHLVTDLSKRSTHSTRLACACRLILGNALLAILVRAPTCAVTVCLRSCDAVGESTLRRVAVSKKIVTRELKLAVFDRNPLVAALLTFLRFEVAQALLVTRLNRLQSALVTRQTAGLVGAPIPASLIDALRHTATPITTGAAPTSPEYRYES
jgi:hypothetical protein